MKHILKVLALASVVAAISPGCVQENAGVRLNGVYVRTDDSCKSADEPDMYATELWYDSEIAEEYSSWLHFSNDLPEESPWASNGSSSSSGATLDSTVVNRNSVYIDKYYFECVSIDDDEDNCDGIDVVEIKAYNQGIKAQATAASYFTISKKILWDFNESTMIRIWAHYHDDGVLSGSNYVTNSIVVRLVDKKPKDGNREAPSYAFFNTYTCKGDLTAPSEDCSVKFQDKDWECEEDDEEENSGGGDTGLE